MGHQAGEQRADYRVSGHVQGVGFRWYTIRLASRLGIRGTVRNCPDGTVEVRAAGTAAALEDLREGLLEGPSHADVASVEDIAPAGHLPPEFRVER
jgi:acylphosphatase